MFYNIGSTSQVKGGWKFQYKADLDFTLQNVSQSAIDKVTLCLDFARDPRSEHVIHYGPDQVTCSAGTESVTTPIQLGHSAKIEWSDLFSFQQDPTTGDYPIIDVNLVSLRYSGGMLADFGSYGVVIGQGKIPSPMTFPANSNCGEPVDLTAEMSAPRSFNNGNYAPPGTSDFGLDTNLLPGQTGKDISQTITAQIVIGKDGSVCDVSILKDSFDTTVFTNQGTKVREDTKVLGPEVYPYRIEALKTTAWFPTIENGVPVTVRMVKTIPIETTVSLH